AALSAGWATFGMEPFDRTDLFLGAFVGLLLVFNAFWSRRRDADADESHVRPQPAYFSALALVTWLATTCNNTRRENLPLVLAGETVLLTLSFYSLRVREITIFGQGYLLLAQ